LHGGSEYTVRSAVPRRSFGDLPRTALLGTSASPVDTTIANGLSAPLATLITSLVQETGVSSADPIAFLQAVMKQFRTQDALAGGAATATVSPTPRSPTPSPTASAHTGGTTFADVLASIRVSHSGTPEQFATLTALIARKLNVPARVVSGFRLPLQAKSTLLAGGTYRVTTAQAWTWVEIPVRGIGWVVLDPSPGTYAGQQAGARNSGTPAPTPSPSPSKGAQLTHSNNGGHAVAPKSKTPSSKSLSAPVLTIIVLAVVALVAVLLVLGLVTRKRIRVRRRRRGGPRERLVGAWQESIDVLAEAGLTELGSATSSEVAESAAERFGPEPGDHARRLGSAANVAIFHPSAPIESSDADLAWQTHAKLRRSVRRRLGWRDRLSAGLRYNRAHRTTAPEAPSSWSTEGHERALAGKARHSRPVRRRSGGRSRSH
jgi:hypothetical protein